MIPLRFWSCTATLKDASCKYHYDRKEVQKHKAEQGGYIIFTGKRVTIPPKSRAGEKTYRLRNRYELVHPPNFHEQVDFLHPTIGVSIEITEAPENYSFHVYPEIDSIGHNRWEYKELFLPGERITIQWERRVSEEPALAAAQAIK
jgi:hypothetical protein